MEPQSARRCRHQHQGDHEENQRALFVRVHLRVSDGLQALGDFLQDGGIIDRGWQLPR